jgi:hypothetical protein
MTRAADPVGEMTRQLREAQAVCQPLPVPDVMKSLREDGIAARIPESVASIPRNPAAYLPESALDKARSGSRRGSIEAAQYPGGALEAALRDMHRLKRLTGL